MRAVLFTAYQATPTLEIVPDPKPTPAGVVIEVKANGVCRSDWHGWMGHDPDVVLPHVPGHELAGVVVETGSDVKGWNVGDRVTVPVVCGCGTCPQCTTGNHQVCDRQFQPGFTAWGSFAEYVAIDFAEVNLIQLPDAMDFVPAASLGCRLVTAFRGVVDQGQVAAGQWVAIHGCGGVGLSATMVATALGANVVAVDINEDKLAFARSLGAVGTVNAATSADVVAEVREITGGGAHVSIDALGHPQTSFNSVSNLRKRGRHVQIGLMGGDHANAPLPMAQVIANELEIVGSHVIQAHRYPDVMAMIETGRLHPEKLIGRTITLEESIEALITMDQFADVGATIIDRF
ncbi:MAG: zinc-dependent alcohol dehydrogenase family protein [Chloroflexota bacterium]